MTHSGRDIALLVDQEPRFRSGNSYLGIYLFDVERKTFHPQTVRHDYKNLNHDPIMAVTPVHDSTGSDYAYIYANHKISVYSLMTGQVIFNRSLSGGC